MDNHTNILLYSKFSLSSRKFVELLDNTPNFNLLCIDNKKTRERVLKSEKLNVKEVPCIIRIYEDTGYVETFEGDRAFKLLKTYLDQYKQTSQTVQPMQMQQQVQPMQTQIQQVQPMQMQQQAQPMQTQIQQQVQPMQMQQQAQPMQMQQVQNIDMAQTQISQLMPESPPKQDSIQKQNQLINATSIEDLGNDINRGQTMNTYMHVPKSVEFDIDIENRQRNVKKDRSVKSSEGGNIVNRAMQMQKEREQETSMQGGQRTVS